MLANSSGGLGLRTEQRAAQRPGRAPLSRCADPRIHKDRAQESRARSPPRRLPSETQTPMPTPNRRCNFSMTNPPCRVIGAKLADAEPRTKNSGVIGSGDSRHLLEKTYGILPCPASFFCSRVRLAASQNILPQRTLKCNCTVSNRVVLTSQAGDCYFMTSVDH